MLNTIKGEHNILVVDDEEDILEFISYNLKKEGYKVETACNGQEAIEKAKKNKPDLILMDLMMPVLNGIEACRRLREIESFNDTFIVFLTARSEEYSELNGFDAGADDYIAKPIKPALLMSRIKAVLRRKKKQENSPEIHAADLTIDREAYEVRRAGIRIVLPRKEFELLSLLASKPGKVFTREIILEKVWGEDVLVVDRTIDVHVRKIREKLGDDYISTVKGVGYKFDKEF